MRPFRHLFPLTERGRALTALACAVVVLAGGVTAAATHAGDDALRVATEGDDRTLVLPPITIPDLPPSTLVDLPGLVTTTTIDLPVTVPPVTLPELPLPSLPLPREPEAVHDVEPLGLYVVRPDGTGLRRLADDCLATPPAWSPDGTRVTCVGVDEARDLKVVRVADGSTSLLGPSSYTLSWSPDGRHIAFIDGTYPDLDVAIVPADGSSPAASVRTPRSECVVTWGPDGRLASMGSEGLWTFAADGSEAKQLSEAPLDFGELAWSPDGSQLLAADDGPNDVAVHTDGSNLRRLGSGHGAETGGLAWDADWAPDSRRIVWYENGWRTGTEILHVGLPEGPWVEVASHVDEPDWSPVADVIAGARLTPDGLRRELVTVGAAGGDVRVVVHAAHAQIRHPAWSPDGSLIAFSTTSDHHIPPN